MSSAVDLRRTRASTPNPVASARVSRKNRAGDSYDNIEPLLAELARTSETDPRRIALRAEAIGRCLPLAEHIARRFAGRGEGFDDLLQIARLGLLHAVDRFDPAYGATFLSFAVPTIMGEVRRYFRDCAWAVRVPRRVKEIQQLLGPATEALTQRLGRQPRAREIAAELGIELEEVTQALVARNAYRTTTIDVVTDNENGTVATSLLDLLGAEEPEYSLVEDCIAVQPLIAALSARERHVLILRFFEFQTQVQIAGQFGISQMQVSRILSKTLNTLREQALRD
ncbi:SigB/SigF/SigG family RNA polymerase sigma factor [Nocardia sp. SYP-A9097]|uniref:SigB/SigF/SigG family RNA polymerase sigma factor n=1 Tax=Nocardia sp. SYP-A9097 TaxID=2663237 RepID=UPI00129A665E|nr:SigB/SigF/SigG family RNA polymerase sigma factor [Nocardia sp. SYP-A9097]MRH90697.1 SigB/SigF/SigG family RNA polymerase sigma factor [Nocardia sp. SYP-A9097]